MRIIKLGGSIITYKNSGTPRMRKERVRNFAKVIHKWLDQSNNRLAIVLGTGSYGHPLAKKFRLDKGVSKTGSIDQSKWKGVIKTRLSVIRLMEYVTDIFLEAGIPVYPVSPGDVYFNVTMDAKIIGDILDNGLVPILHGDMVLDDSRGAIIYSGDNITIDLARIFEADEVHFATEGNGITLNGKHVPQIRSQELVNLMMKKSKDKISNVTDVSSGFLGKIGACLEYIPKKGIRIYNGSDIADFKRGFLENKGGTLIER